MLAHCMEFIRAHNTKIVLNGDFPIQIPVEGKFINALDECKIEKILKHFGHRKQGVGVGLTNLNR